MDYKKIFKDAFSDVALQTDEESFIKSVTERKINMESKKRIGIKKPIIAVCAAIAALSLGTVGAAAAGLINFNEIFGRTIKTQDEELGEKLIANAADVKWTVSDDDYVVNLKGVTGTNSEMVAVIEIARADGQPVKDYLSSLDFLYESGFFSAFESVQLNGEFDRMGGGGCGSVLNDNGNIEITFERMGPSLNGTKIEMKCMGVYPTEELNDAPIDPLKEVYMFSGSEGYYLNDNEKAALEKIELLDLSWTLEFTYTPSDTGEKEIIFDNFNETVEMSFDVYENGEGTGVSESFDVVVEGLKADSMGVELNIYFDTESYKPAYMYSFQPDIEKNEIKFIYKDGTEIPVVLSSWNAGGDEDGYSMDLSLRYYEGESVIAADIAEISAVSVNGIIYNV